MRFDGKLKTWNDERGFGFIEPVHGGEEIFVHIKAFPRGSARPAVAQLLSFEVEPGARGKRRATGVRLTHAPARSQRTVRHAPAPWGAATLLVLPVFVILLIVIAVVWRPPRWVAGIYGIVSMATFLAYAADKAAARRGGPRTAERTLHLLALAGGWPGALVAQQFLRHKTTKAAFRKYFWLTVLFNVGALLLACSPVGRRYWALS